VKLIYAVLILGFISSSCKEKEIIQIDKRLPPATQSGQNTFGCLVNGEVWLPQGEDPGWVALVAFGSRWGEGLVVSFSENLERPLPFQHALSIRAYQDSVRKNGSSLNIRMDQVRDTGIYTLGPAIEFDETSTEGILSYGSINATVSTYQFLRITHLDRENRIISGTFEFDAIHITDDPDTFRIRQGRFDLQY